MCSSVDKLERSRAALPLRRITAARCTRHVAVANAETCGSCLTCHLRAAVLGSVLGCLMICIEVAVRGLRWKERAAPTVNSVGGWFDNRFHDK